MEIGQNINRIVWVKFQSFHWEGLNVVSSEKITSDLWKSIEILLWDKVNEKVLDVYLESNLRRWI